MEALKLLTDAVLKLLVGYLEFALDLFSLHGLSPFARSNKVSSLLLSYFIAGSAVAYFLTKGRTLPGISSNLTPEERQGADQMTFGFMVVKVFIFAAASHAVLLACSEMGLARIGSVRDTLNAWLASAAVMLPLCVIARRVSNAGSVFMPQQGEFLPASGAGRAFGLMLMALSTTIDITVFTYYGLVLARVHEVRPVVGLLPGLICLGLVLAVVVAGWLWKKLEPFRVARMIARRRRKLETADFNPYKP